MDDTDNLFGWGKRSWQQTKEQAQPIGKVQMQELQTKAVLLHFRVATVIMRSI